MTQKWCNIWLNLVLFTYRKFILSFNWSQKSQVHSQVSTELILKIKKNNICRTDAVAVYGYSQKAYAIPGRMFKNTMLVMSNRNRSPTIYSIIDFWSPFVFKWQALCTISVPQLYPVMEYQHFALLPQTVKQLVICLLYTSDAADE